jgi:cytochrome c5
MFPGDAKADAINNNCLACHSAGMVLTQPVLSRAEWQSEVEKMRSTYKAPVEASDVPAIVDYLVALKDLK